MPQFVPHRFLVRLSHPCLWQRWPSKKPDFILPESARIESHANLDGTPVFAELRLAWNEAGLLVNLAVRGKKNRLSCDVNRPKFSDGLSLWIDTRGVFSSHRASQFCHQFICLPSGAGEDESAPIVLPQKINRALLDAPLAASDAFQITAQYQKHDYALAIQIPALALNGYDPEQHPQLGFSYAVRDAELGEQYLSVNNDFPVPEDPSLWEVLALQPAVK